MCMCFLLLGDEFSATALMSEETRIKNTYTDGTYLCVCITKYTLPEPIHNLCGTAHIETAMCRVHTAVSKGEIY